MHSIKNMTVNYPYYEQIQLVTQIAFFNMKYLLPWKLQLIEASSYILEYFLSIIYTKFAVKHSTETLISSLLRCKNSKTRCQVFLIKKSIFEIIKGMLDFNIADFLNKFIHWCLYIFLIQIILIINCIKFISITIFCKIKLILYFSTFNKVLKYVYTFQEVNLGMSVNICKGRNALPF